MLRRSFFALCVLAVGCGGSVAPGSTSSTASSSSSGASGAASSSGTSGSNGASSGGDDGDRSCTSIGCSSNLTVDFSYRDQGTYQVQLLLDGTAVFCKTTIPLPKGNSMPCSRSDVLLGLSGSELPVAQQSVGPLIVTSFPTKVEIVISRDDAPLGNQTYDVKYKVTPGPNGPGCEPLECKSAQVSFP